MTKLYEALKAALAKYPAITAAALNIAVAIVARFGFHVTADQLVGFGSVLIALVSGITHAGYVHKANNGNLS